MSEHELDELLRRKRAVKGDFPSTADAFAADFFVRVNRPPRSRKWSYTAWAAGFLVLIAVTAMFTLPLLRQPFVCYDPYDALTETVRLFGGDAAVLFVGNDLVTGERDRTSAPENVIDIDFVGDDGKWKLMLACSDDDAITVDATHFSGSIVASRCDSRTLVLDVVLEVNGKAIRTAIPVIRRGNHYYAVAELS